MKAGEFAIMSVLMLANRVPEMVTHQRAGRWQKLWGAVLDGRRVTVVGLGSLGGAAAMQADAVRYACDRGAHDRDAASRIAPR